MNRPRAAEPPTLEVCVASPDFALAAERAGADRVELCSDLVEGGVTPSAGAIELACERCGVPVMVMIRPRGGDFLYTDLEVASMLVDIDVAKTRGARGVVLGALTPEGRVDRDRTRRLIDAARPLEVTFHRAFDLTRDLLESLDALVEIGVDRVLTSAGAATVLDALDTLARLTARAGADLSVMPAGGIRPVNVAEVLGVPGVREIHVGASGRAPSAMTFRRPGVPMGRAYEPDEYHTEVADVERIRTTVDALRGPARVGG